MFNIIRKLSRPVEISEGRFVGRSKTRDVAFVYRMGAGFVGDVNRMHPASIEPCLVDPTNPPLLFGVPVLIDPTSQGARRLLTSDTGITWVYGVTVRPYPFQQSTAALAYAQANFGGEAPATVQPMDILRYGYIMVQVVGTPAKSGSVFIWVGAPSGAHVTGGWETTSSGSTIALDARYRYNGPPDANGVTELFVNA